MGDSGVPDEESDNSADEHGFRDSVEKHSEKESDSSRSSKSESKSGRSDSESGQSGKES